MVQVAEDPSLADEQLDHAAIRNEAGQDLFDDHRLGEAVQAPGGLVGQLDVGPLVPLAARAGREPAVARAHLDHPERNL